MTFSLIKAAGWYDNIQSLTAAEIGAFDLNQSRAVDGAAGGIYSPAGTIQVNGSGFGSDRLTNVTATGVLQRAASARWVWRTSTTTILDQAAAQVLDMSYDTYRTTIDHANNINIRLAVTTGQQPTEGDILQVVRIGIPTAPRTFIIYSEEAPAAPLAQFPVAAGGVQSNTVYMGEFWFTGATWVPLRLSADVV
jgi:hypothetical protein